MTILVTIEVMTCFFACARLYSEAYTTHKNMPEEVEIVCAVYVLLVILKGFPLEISCPTGNNCIPQLNKREQMRCFSSKLLCIELSHNYEY